LVAAAVVAVALAAYRGRMELKVSVECSIDYDVSNYERKGLKSLTISCTKGDSAMLDHFAFSFANGNLTAYVAYQTGLEHKRDLPALHRYSKLQSRRPSRAVALQRSERDRLRKIALNFKLPPSVVDGIKACSANAGVPVSHFILFCCIEDRRLRFLAISGTSKRGAGRKKASICFRKDLLKWSENKDR
jgi:hypothetical protein